MENTEYEEFLVQNENQMSAALKELIFDRFKFQMLHNSKHSIQVPLNPAFLRYIFMNSDRNHSNATKVDSSGKSSGLIERMSISLVHSNFDG